MRRFLLFDYKEGQGREEEQRSNTKYERRTKGGKEVKLLGLSEPLLLSRSFILSFLGEASRERASAWSHTFSDTHSL